MTTVSAEQVFQLGFDGLIEPALWHYGVMQQSERNGIYISYVADAFI